MAVWFVLLLTLITQPIYPASCISILTALNQQFVNFGIDAGDLPPRALAKRIARLRVDAIPTLSEHEKSELLDLFSSMEVRDGDQISGGEGLFNRFFVTIPIQYRETYLDYLIRLHEFEHLIQRRILRKQKGRVIPILREAFSLGDLRYFAEEGAMSMESLFLNAVPQSAIPPLIALLSSDAKLKIFVKEILVLALENSSSPVEDYLAVQRNADRYSRLACYVGSLFRWSAAIGIGSLGGAASYFLSH
jgi:hypothetical protein